jgi:hypothetical protein
MEWVQMVLWVQSKSVQTVLVWMELVQMVSVPMHRIPTRCENSLRQQQLVVFTGLLRVPSLAIGNAAIGTCPDDMLKVANAVYGAAACIIFGNAAIGT